MSALLRISLFLFVLAPLMLFGATNEVVVTSELETLRHENDALRKENQRLRRELVRRRGGVPVIDMTAAQSETPAQEGADVKITDDGGYWLATKSMKRHNSKCRYYKMGKGRPCKKDEGEACKKCGG